MPQVAAISPDGNSALHLATKEGFMANVRLLLDQGAKINVRNKAGLTPLGALSQSPDGDDGIQLFCWKEELRSCRHLGEQAEMGLV